MSACILLVELLPWLWPDVRDFGKMVCVGAVPSSLPGGHVMCVGQPTISPAVEEMLCGQVNVVWQESNWLKAGERWRGGGHLSASSKRQVCVFQPLGMSQFKEPS